MQQGALAAKVVIPTNSITEQQVYLVPNVYAKQTIMIVGLEYFVHLATVLARLAQQEV